GLGQAAYIARMGRSSLLEVIREDYVRTARAKGLNRRLVIALHALPNALLPVITLSGVLLGLVLAGSIPVERAFGVPGLGYSVSGGVSVRVVSARQTLVFVSWVVFVLLNFGVVPPTPSLDPRIGLGGPRPYPPPPLPRRRHGCASSAAACACCSAAPR